jgi:hypothetical protein
VKRVIARTGIEAGNFPAHSLRAGMMTAADLLGIPLDKAMEHGRWKCNASAGSTGGTRVLGREISPGSCRASNTESSSLARRTAGLFQGHGALKIRSPPSASPGAAIQAGP